MVETTAPSSDRQLGDEGVRRAYEQARRNVDAPGVASAVRPVIWDSWRRSMRNGISPNSLIEADIAEDDFCRYRAGHPMTLVRPVVRSLMLDDIKDSGVVLALTDETGRLLWVEGDPEARDRAGAINFVEGSLWSEDVIGANAPGLALRLDQCIQITGPEHFAEPVQQWSCAAAPVHDPATGHVIGAVDITGGRVVSVPFALSAVRLAVAAVERELGSRAVDLDCARDPDYARQAVPRLSVLGEDGPRWSVNGSVRPLSRRHAEILILLNRFSEGMDTEQLALHLADDGLDPVTVRAEISRLRRDLGSELIRSRPYRFAEKVVSDVDEVRGLIARRELAESIARFGRGGLLAASTAPGVMELFDEMREDVRSAVLGTSDVSVLRQWLGSPHGRDDIAAWHRLAGAVPAGHPDRVRAEGRIRLLDRRFGV